jgi:NAD(P)-dependent dehydrogenase (short-subunit alcohol dehydrogenase family)
MDTLEGRTAVITGSGSGIGRAIATELARSGMNVVIADIDESAAQAVAGELAESGTRTLALKVDVADFASVTAAADAAFTEFGSVHVLCNNAGVLLFNKMTELTLDDWRWVHGVNVWGVLHGIYGFMPRMLEQGEPGHIVNTSSIAALSGHGVYGTSKIEVLAITETLRDDLADTNIGVSCLFPGMVSTRIVTAQRNRTDAFGPRARDVMGFQDSDFGCDPVYVGRRVKEAILADEFYVFAGIPEGNEVRLKEGPPVRAAALVDAIDAGVVPNESGLVV